MKTNIKKQNKGTFGEVANKILDFTEEITGKVNRQIVLSVADKFNQLEPQLFQ